MNNGFLIKNKIINSLKKFEGFDLIKNSNSIFIIALSGGTDSMCMLNIFYDLKQKYNFKLYAMHINHGIRGEEAERDLKFVVDYCNKKKIDIFYDMVDCIEYSKKFKLSIEESARILRYKILSEKRKQIIKIEKNENVYIVTAHHKNDQAETILHNIIRGSGITGLIGIKEVNGYYLRPFLKVSKNDIDNFVKNFNIPYIIDSTNYDIIYTRNFLRQNILPELSKINNNAIDHICEISDFSLEVEKYLYKIACKKFDEVLLTIEETKIVIDSKKFNDNENIIKFYIIKCVFDNLNINKKNITKTHINDVFNLSTKSNNKHLDLPYNLTVDKKNNKLIFMKHNENFSMLHKRKV